MVLKLYEWTIKVENGDVYVAGIGSTRKAAAGYVILYVSEYYDEFVDDITLEVLEQHEPVVTYVDSCPVIVVPCVF